MGQRKRYVFSWLIKEIIMNDKSHVGMGHYMCPYCGTKHSEVVLVNKSLKDTLERENMLGYELCDEHKLLAKDYILLIGTTADPNTDKTALLTGENIALKRGEFSTQMFTIDINEYDYVFVESSAVTHLINLFKDAENVHIGESDTDSN
jgi:hypothetical protein